MSGIESSIMPFVSTIGFVNKSATPESFANLNSFKNALNGQSGSIIDILGNTNMLITYKPVKAFQNTFVVLLMQANNSNIKEDS